MSGQGRDAHGRLEWPRWWRLLVPGGPRSWLRAAFISVSCWLIGVFILFPYPARYPQWVEYVTFAALAALPLLIGAGFFLGRRLGIALLLTTALCVLVVMSLPVYRLGS